MEIIYEINQRFLERVHIKFLGNPEKLSNLSLIDESGEKYVRMANLACVGSHAINSVASSHSKLLKKTVLRDFYKLFIENFTNVANKEKNWVNLIKHPDKLQKLEEFVDNLFFRHQCC